VGRLLRKSAPSQKAIPPTPHDSQDESQKPDLPHRSSVSGPEAKVGSSVATLWLKVNQDNQPPASVPSTLLPLGNCPCCHHVLAPPLKSSGQQVCVKCGWANQPRVEASSSTVVDGQSDADLLRLLEQAASESLENMKPRKKHN
jgi:hypothetical protein